MALEDHFVLNPKKLVNWCKKKGLNDKNLNYIEGYVHILPNSIEKEGKTFNTACYGHHGKMGEGFEESFAAAEHADHNVSLLSKSITEITNDNAYNEFICPNIKKGELDKAIYLNLSEETIRFIKILDSYKELRGQIAKL